MSDSKSPNLEERAIATIRTLAADTVQKANSGHPGAPMGMAVMAHVMWSEFMKYSPSNPKWIGRDRFVLSNGHSCALQYIMMCLTGYEDVPVEELKKFRQLGSKTPGHPEAHVTRGIEVSTGPLGQGISNAVGLAIAQTQMAATYNRPGFNLFDNFTYVFCGDGCLQEGVASEACSLAGHLGLGKLIVLYDDNDITIDGGTNLSFTEDVTKRFDAYGWHTIKIQGGNSDTEAIRAAVKLAQRETGRPSLISIKTTIGFGSAKQGTHGVHGAPLGDDDVASVKAKFGFDSKSFFQIPSDVKSFYGKQVGAGKALEAEWDALFQAYGAKFPSEAKEIKRRFDGKLPEGWEQVLPKYAMGSKAVATRNLSGEVLNALAKICPEIVGGSADLTPSNKTQLKCSGDYQKATRGGRYFRFGVREHGMGAIGNGIQAYGGYIPFTATFLTFIEYMFPAVRLAALSGHQHLFIMTHDSIGLGEDGPTHQPIEQVGLCRATPNLLTFRPCDGNEVAGAYAAALKNRTTPVVMALSRQKLPTINNTSVENTLRGGYTVVDAKNPDVVLIATGSEVTCCVEASKALSGVKVKIVSMPCTELFDEQSIEYRQSVLPKGVPVIAVEAASPNGWYKYANYVIGMTTFGASGPGGKVMDYFGFTPAKVAASVKQWLDTTGAALRKAGAASVPSQFLPAAVRKLHYVSHL